jgi:AhpD family alkylhydroperoxidase
LRHTSIGKASTSQRCGWNACSRYSLVVGRLHRAARQAVLQRQRTAAGQDAVRRKAAVQHGLAQGAVKPALEVFAGQRRAQRQAADQWRGGMFGWHRRRMMAQVDQSDSCGSDQGMGRFGTRIESSQSRRQPMSTTFTSHQPRMTYETFARLAPKANAALLNLGGASHAAVDMALLELIEVRASQMNGCAYCVHYHLGLARKAGVEQVKLDLLAVWREAGVFSPREMAALDFAEHLVAVSQKGVPDAVWDGLKVHFSEAEIAGLCSAVANISAWNRIAISMGFVPALAQ